jgi:hypothetical protein
VFTHDSDVYEREIAIEAAEIGVLATKKATNSPETAARVSPELHEYFFMWVRSVLKSCSFIPHKLLHIWAYGRNHGRKSSGDDLPGKIFISI